LFDLIVKAIETGEPQSTEYFYPHEGFNKWFTCMFVKFGDGVVATNMDTSDRKRAEEQVRKLEAEKQREIFEVSLSTLEEERHRISESLHNGIAQILYGIKINMSGLTYGMQENEFRETKSYINQLLTDSIVETRRISHELMPTTLEQFGLKSAIDDICLQLTDGTKFNCQITGMHRRMEKYLELAVYRTAQELMTNVIKHAKATECTVLVNIGRQEITIRVSDNGKGLASTQTHKPGIGLASIRSKINLLNGEVNLSSVPGEGTTVEVIIPQPEKKATSNL
jgi:signal transduction histidine kinase